MSTVITSLSVKVDANVGAALGNLRKVGDELNKLTSTNTDINLNLGVQFKPGTAEKLKRSVQTICSTLSQNAFIQVDFRLKPGALADLRAAVRSATGGTVNVNVGSNRGGGSGGAGGGTPTPPAGGNRGGGSNPADVGISREAINAAAAISREIDKAVTSVNTLATQWNPAIAQLREYERLLKEINARERLDNKAIASLSSAWSPAISAAKQYEMEVQKAIERQKELARQQAQAGKTTNIGGQILNQQQAQNAGAQWAKEIEEALKKSGQATDRWGNDLVDVLREVQNQTQQTNTWFDKARRTILAFATGYLVIQGATMAMRELKEATIGYNQTIDSARIGFESLVGSLKGADSLIAQMQTLAETTPFEFKDLLPLSQQLLMAGRNAKTLVGDMRAVGDHVARIGEGKEFIDRIVYALNQISTAGKVAGTEIRQLTEARVPAVKILAESWGVTTEKMQEFVKEGVIPADKAVDALIKGMGRDAFGYMSKQAKTFGGALSNLRDTFQRVMGQASRSHFDKMTVALNALVKTIQTPEFRKWATQTMGYVFGTIEKFVALMTWAAKQINDKSVYIAIALAAMTSAKIIAGINALSIAIQVATSRFILAGATVGVVAAAWAAAIIALIAVYRNFGIVRDIMENVALVAITMVKTVAHAITWLIGQISTPMQILAEKLAQIPDTLFDKMGEAGKRAREIRDSIVGFVKIFDMRGLEQDSDKYWDGIIADFQRGKAKFDQAIQGSLWDIVGYKPKITGDPYGDPADQPVAPQIPDYSGQFRPGKDDDKAEKARLKRLKDMLGDSADAWKKYAQAVEQAAKKMISDLSDMQKSIGEIFKDIQTDLISKGVIDDPLGGAIRALGDMLKFGDRIRRIAREATDEIRRANAEERQYRSQLEREQGKDGVVPARGGATITVQSKNPTGTAKRGYLDTAPSGAPLTQPWERGDGPPGVGAVAPMPVSRLKAPPTRFRGQNITEANPFAEELKNASNALTDLRAVQKGWGEAVRDIEGSASRFQMQTFLTTKQGADFLAQTAAALESKGGAEKLKKIGQELGIAFNFGNLTGLDKAAAFLRQVTNAMDVKANRAVLPALLKDFNTEYEKFVREQRIERDVSQAGNAFIAANGANGIRLEQYTRLLRQQKQVDALQFETGDRALIPLETRRAELMGRFNLENAAKQAELYASAFFEASKAIEDAGKELAGLNDETVQQIAHRRIYTAENAYLLSDLTKQKRLAAEIALELGKLDREHTLKLREMADEMQLVTRESGLIAQGLTDSRITEQLQFHTDLTAKQNQLVRAGVNPLKAFGMAAEEAHGAKRIRMMRDANQLYREQNQLLRDSAAEITQQTKLQGIILSTETGSYARERASAIENKLKELTDKHQGKPFAGTAIATEFVEFVQVLDSQTLTRALDAYKQQIDEGADATKLFADMSGMAAIALKLQKDVTVTLDEAKKAELLTTAASILGLQRYGSERDALFSQQFGLMQELETRRLSMTRNLTGLQEQELQWKYADLEADTRLIGMNQELRDAYDAQRPAVLKLRDAVRALHTQMDSLKVAEWRAGFNERFEELTSGLGDLAGLRTELLRDQVSDADIEIILNKERWLSLAENISQNVGDTFSSLFDGIMNHSDNLFDELLANVKKTMQQIAMEILMSQVYQWIGGVVGGVFSGVAGRSGSAVGGEGGAPVDFGSGDMPVDVSARSSRKNLYMAPRDAGLVNSLAGGGSGGGGVVVNQYIVDKVVSNTPEEFAKKLPGQQASRAQMNRQVVRSMANAGSAG